MKFSYKLFFISFIIGCFGIIAYGNTQNIKPDQVQIIPHYDMNSYDAKISAFYKEHPASQSPILQQRFNVDSEFFLGQPYQLGALGEGPTARFDKDPLYRTDAFDCMTYVSTVVAMVEANDLEQFKKAMLAIQYSNSKAHYETRNHFTSVDWNLNNEKKGYLKDITKELFPKSYQIATAAINKSNWYAKLSASNIKQFTSLTSEQTQKLLTELHALGKKTPIQISRLAYVPLTALFNKDGKPKFMEFDKIPSDVVIEIVRPNWNLKNLIGTNLNVSHMGLGIRINGILYFREASSIENKVVDIPLTDYLAQYLHNATVKGIHLEAINLKN